MVNATSGYTTYQWILNGSTISANADSIYASQQGNYTVVVSDNIGCTASDTLTVSVSNPSVTIGQNITLCNNDSLLITATPGYSSYQWTINGITIPATTNSIFANQQGSYVVMVTDTIGCTDSDTISVAVSNPVVTLGPDVVLCNGDSALLTATAGYAIYQWLLNGNIISNNTDSLYASQQGSYVVSVNDTAGCTATDTLVVTINTAAISIGQNINMCRDDSVLISATPGYPAYQWLLNGSPLITNVNSLYASQQGNYVVIVTDSIGCTSTDSVLVTISIPSVTIGPDVILCNSDSVLITAAAGFSSYQWLVNGITLPSNTNTSYVSQSGNYILIVADSIGCTTSDTLNADSSSITLSLINDTSFCTGNSLLINGGSGFASYQWQLNNTTISSADTIIVNQTGNYFLTVSNADGCTATDNVDVIVNPLPVIQTINNTTVCIGNSVTLLTTGAANYVWTPATYLSSAIVASPVSSPLTPISYSVTGTDSNGCTATAQVSIQVGDSPEALFDYTTQFNCNGLEFHTANNSTNAVQYTWLFGDGTTSNAASPVHYYSSLQNQTVQLIASNGNCADTFQIENVSFLAGEFHFIPNAFTPNNDGRNDCYQIEGIENLSACFSISIFNRWGGLIYQSDDTGNCWDGKTNNTEAPQGAYFYVISIKDEKYIGSVNLIR